MCRSMPKWRRLAGVNRGLNLYDGSRNVRL